jgi:hypothetical protein
MPLCGLCGRDGGERYLCERDTTALAKRLVELPKLYAEVAECLVPRRGGWGEIVSTKGAAGPRSPIDEDVLDTVNAVRAGELVHLWRVDVQRVRWPHHSAPPQDGGLPAHCRWLGMELEWIAVHYPAVGDLARELRDLEKQARAIVGDPVPQRKVIGQCIAVVGDQGAVCGADITHRAGESKLVCHKCHCKYTTQQELLLLLHYQPDGVA